MPWYTECKVYLDSSTQGRVNGYSQLNLKTEQKEKGRVMVLISLSSYFLA